MKFGEVFILGIQFEHPSWWREIQIEDLIRYNVRVDGNDTDYPDHRVNVQSFLPPLSEVLLLPCPNGFN